LLTQWGGDAGDGGAELALLGDREGIEHELPDLFDVAGGAVDDLPPAGVASPPDGW
jgi:hypothetical protein